MSNINEYSPESGVVLVGDAGLNVDLGFIPDRSIFFADWSGMEQFENISELVVADNDPDRTIQKTREAFSRGLKQVTVVWNVERNKPYSYAMLLLAREAAHSSFSVVGSTAHLELSSKAENAMQKSVSPAQMRDMLQEQVRKPSGLSAGELNFLIMDYSDLLDEMEILALKDSQLRLELEVLQKRTEQLPELHNRLRVLQSENTRLRKRNDTLARKALKELTKVNRSRMSGSNGSGKPVVEKGKN